jgi:hypothetical protein
MEMKYNKFSDGLDTAVFTTKYILEKHSPVLYVYHYRNDGAWQFSSIENCIEEDYRIISLEEMIKIDNSILELVNMPLGYYAKRENNKSKWEIKYIE